MRTALVVMVMVGVAFLSRFLSLHTCNSDFPVFYHAATTVLDPAAAAAAVYLPPSTAAEVPEPVSSVGAFVYSLAAAYLLAPLGLLPYYGAKALLIFLDALAFLGALALVSRSNGAAGRLFLYPLAVSFLWPPLLQDLRSGQVNALLLLLLALSALLANRRLFAASGVLLGIASLFKLFPLGIAAVFAARNWRIFSACLLTVLATFAIPGSSLWFHAMTRVGRFYSPLYLLLKGLGEGWYLLFAALVMGATAAAFYLWEADFNAALSMAIPAVLLVVPVIEYYHYTLALFTVVYHATSPRYRGRPVTFLLVLPVTLISLSFLATASSASFHYRPGLLNGALLLSAFLLWSGSIAACRIHGRKAALPRPPC